jgi:23S rRNA pseudouridine2605 synthase
LSSKARRGGFQARPRVDEKSFLWLAFNKPADTITTRRDPQGRRTVYEFLPQDLPPRVEAVGRLDRASTGLLLFTNDSKLSQALLNPQNRIPRVYQVVTNFPLPAEAQAKLAAGLTLADGTRLGSIQIKPLDTPAPGRSYQFTLYEGKYREIRKVVMVFNCRVRGLHRLSFAGIELGDLRGGAVRRLTPQEILGLKRAGQVLA